MSSNGWFTTQEASEYLNISPHTLRTWAYQRLIRAYKGPARGKQGLLRFRREDLDAALTPSEPLPQGTAASA